MREALLTVNGMTCSACVNTITAQVMTLVGVDACNLSLVTNECHVKYQESKCTVETIIETINDCGFDSEFIRDNACDINANSIQGLLTIQGMTCGSCVASVTQQVQKLQGIKKVVVSLVTEECHVEFDPSEVSLEHIRESIENCGFDANIISTAEPTNSSLKKATLKILNIDVESNLSETTAPFESLVGGGIISANMSSNAILSIEYDRKLVGIRDLIHRIRSLGYEAVIASSLDSTTQLKLLSKVREIQYWRSTCLKACFFAITTMLVYMIIPMVIPKLKRSHIFPYNETFFLRGLFYRDIIGFLASTYVQFGIGSYFYKAFWNSLKHKVGTMDTLVCISTSCAYVFSLYSIIRNIVHPNESGQLPNVIFDTSVMLIAFISLGKLLENKAKSATSTALSKLISLTPSSCIILEKGDPQHLLEIPIDQLDTGDIVEVKPGMRIPADGIITEGETEIDESLMTGESFLVHKTKGTTVIGGSINGPGHFYFMATAVGDESTISNIIKTMKQAQLTKAPIQRYADFLASIFVPSILFLALTTFIVWFILSKALLSSLPIWTSENGRFYTCFQTAISVVIVACPCALGLAAPTAIMVGTGVGAQNQVLIKSGDVLERFNKVGAFIFDKTGTLTTGCMKVKHFLVENSTELTCEIIACMKAAESISEHPVAKAIVNYCNDKQIDAGKESIVANVMDSKIFMGKGLQCSCEINGSSYRLIIGSKSLMPSQWQEFPSSLYDEDEGFTVSYVCINDVVVGRFEIVDEIKKDAYETVQYMNNKGYKTYMVTGDTHSCAIKVAQQVGISLNNVFSEITPDGKADVVQQLKNELNENVVFIGDGINDSPALVISDVGISISTGTDIAMEAADVVILCDSDPKRASLKGLVYAMDISQKTFRRVKLNLFWALCYNTFMIPIAMGVLIPWGITLHPMAAGLAMAMSSVSVVLSSLALKRWRPIDLNSRQNSFFEAKRRSIWSKVFTRDSQRNEDIELQTELIRG